MQSRPQVRRHFVVTTTETEMSFSEWRKTK